MSKPSDAVVRSAGGREEPLGEWIVGLLKASGQSVTETMDRANLSRSFYYLLKDGKQVPSVESLVSLLEAIPVDEVRLAAPTEPGDLYVQFEGESYWVVLRYSGRRSLRSRNAWQSLNQSADLIEPEMDLPPMGVSALSMAPQSRAAAPSSRGARKYQIRDGAPTESRMTDDRSKLLGELLNRAADLDTGRLRLLIAQADLLRDDW